MNAEPRSGKAQRTGETYLVTIIEAKWERFLIDFGPITKLSRRITQRLAGTRDVPLPCRLHGWGGERQCIKRNRRTYCCSAERTWKPCSLLCPRSLRTTSGTGERKVAAFWAQFWHSCVASVQVADPKLGSMLLAHVRQEYERREALGPGPPTTPLSPRQRTSPRRCSVTSGGRPPSWRPHGPSTTLIV